VSDEPDTDAIRSALVAADEMVDGDVELRPLPGGASRDIWVVTSGERRWVLRRDPVGEIAQTSREAEFAVQLAAHQAGVPVPRPIVFGDFGTPGMLMDFIEGESIPRRDLRSAPAGIVRQLGQALRALRDVDAAALGTPPADPCADAVARVRAELDAAGEALPALELGLRWLTLNIPAPTRPGVVHGDLRLGNFIVGADGLRAIVDWEFWHLGDPVEDLAWVCARPWRFGSDDKAAAGLSGLEELLDGLGLDVEPARLRWWDVISQAKWGAYCARQAELRRTGAHESLERTVLARRVAEAEWDMLELIEA
jgi:aminoglycoside phosphotransferase (APT) family kinase protein